MPASQAGGPRLTRESPTKKIVLSRMWETLPEETRRRTLMTLSRIVAQQQPPPSQEKEVTHEDC